MWHDTHLPISWMPDKVPSKRRLIYILVLYEGGVVHRIVYDCTWHRVGIGCLYGGGFLSIVLGGVRGGG